MAYVYALDVAVPANTDAVSGGAQQIRELKAAVRERINSFFVNVDTDPLAGKDGAVLGNTTVKALTPVADNTYALGTNLLRFSDLRVNTATFSSNVSIGGTAAITGAVTLSSTMAVTGNIFAGDDVVFGAAVVGDARIRKVGDDLQARLGDDSDYTDFRCKRINTDAGSAWDLKAAAVVSPTSPNRTLAVTIDGTNYYIHAKTTND